jgi:hypothetical protein
MDITLSEAPIYVVIQTCLTPAPKERAFFYACASRMALCTSLKCPVSESPPGNGELLRGIVVLQR